MCLVMDDTAMITSCRDQQVAGRGAARGGPVFMLDEPRPFAGGLRSNRLCGIPHSGFGGRALAGVDLAAIRLRAGALDAAAAALELPLSLRRSLLSCTAFPAAQADRPSSPGAFVGMCERVARAGTMVRSA